MERLLKSKFKIGEKISENPFSLTYRGTTLSGNQPVIIKIYKRGTLNSALIKAMKQKVKLLSELLHPGIARLLDGDYGWQGFYYVRELVEGPSLMEKFKTTPALDPFDAEKIIIKICEALSAAHQMGIVHGALKPTNIFVGPEVKLTDFIIEGEIKESYPQKAVSVLEDNLYLSPEEILGWPASTSSDIYALGTIFYEMLAGAYPYYPSPLYKLKSPPPPPPNLSPYLSTILNKCLQSDPLLRFKTVDDLRESLRQRTLVEDRKNLDLPAIEMENAPQAEEKEIKIIKQERKRSFFLLIVAALAVTAGIIYALITSFLMRP